MRIPKQMKWIKFGNFVFEMLIEKLVCFSVLPTKKKERKKEKNGSKFMVKN